MTGILHKIESQLWLSVKLVETTSGRCRYLLREKFTEADVSRIDDVIAKRIMERLDFGLAELNKPVTGRVTDNPKARHDFFLGRMYADSITESGLQKGVKFLKRAIEIDPRFADARAALAACYVFLGHWGSMPLDDAFQQARAESLEALELNDSLVEAHASLGVVHCLYDWDWLAAETEFTKAIELSTSYAVGNFWYALLLAITGRGNEAVEQAMRAREIDPLSPFINTHVGFMLFQARRYAEALEHCSKALKLGHPEFALSRINLGSIYGAMGRWDEAIVHFEATNGLPGHLAPACLAWAYASGGYEHEACEILEDLRAKSVTEYVPPTYLAWIYLGLKDNDQAMEWLEKAYDARDGQLIWINSSPAYNAIRSDDRFNALLNRMRFTEESRVGT